METYRFSGQAGAMATLAISGLISNPLAPKTGSSGHQPFVR